MNSLLLIVQSSKKYLNFKITSSTTQLYTVCTYYSESLLLLMLNFRSKTPLREVPRGDY